MKGKQGKKPASQDFDSEAIPQHKRMAMGKPVNGGKKAKGKY